ncbi:DUF3795 domain-containing protein [Acidobacteriota bacterium]
MDEKLAVCGILCSECGAFQATKENDDQKRAEVAKLWSKEYNSDIKPEDINCEGCQSDGEILFSHTRVCEIRKCGKERGVENCAYCGDYSCEKLEKLLEMVPECRKRLDEVRNKR